MRQIIMLMMIFIFSVPIKAQVTLETCSQLAVDFLSEITAPKELPFECLSLIENTSSYLNKDSSSDNLVEFTGYRNILYAKTFTLDSHYQRILDTHRITAGHKTKITDILALDFLEENSKVYLLNKNETDYTIVSFLYNISGNIEPSRELYSRELDSASNLAADYDSQRIFVISKSEAWVKSFNLKADPRGKRQENSTNLQTLILGITTGLTAPVDIALYGSELFVLENNKILVFNKTDNGPIAPKREIAGDKTTLDQAKSVRINSAGNLEVINGDDQIIFFPPNAEGNVSPIISFK